MSFVRLSEAADWTAWEGRGMRAMVLAIGGLSRGVCWDGGIQLRSGCLRCTRPAGHNTVVVCTKLIRGRKV